MMVLLSFLYAHRVLVTSGARGGNKGTQAQGDVYPKQAGRSACDSRSPGFHVNKENKSASLLIPSAGRDKLSPLMKSFHRLCSGAEPVYVYCTELIC